MPLNLPALPAGLWRVMLGTTLVVSSYSLLNPVLAVRLQTAGASNLAVGLVAMLPFLSVALLVPVVSRVFDRVGVGRAYRIGLLLELLSCLGYLVTDDYRAWCALSLMAGIGAAAAWNATEGLIAHNVPATHRGRLTGLYQALLGAGMALGPFLPGLLGLTPTGANVLAAAGLALGLGAATSIAGVLGMGSFALQYPLGWLADHVPSRRLFAGGAALLALSGVAFTQAAAWPPLLWLCAALWGGLGGALYTLSMIRVAHDFEDTSALAGTSAMIAGYTAGGALGPLVSGWFFDHAGVGGQGTWLAALGLSLLVLQRRRRA